MLYAPLPERFYALLDGIIPDGFSTPDVCVKYGGVAIMKLNRWAFELAHLLLLWLEMGSQVGYPRFRTYGVSASCAVVRRPRDNLLACPLRLPPPCCAVHRESTRVCASLTTFRRAFAIVHDFLLTALVLVLDSLTRPASGSS